jgi:hypothetical protein
MLIAVLTLLTASVPSQPTGDARAYIKSFYESDSMGWSRARATLRLTVYPKSGRPRLRGLSIHGASIDGRTHTLVRFTEPVELAGTAMLVRQETDQTTTQLMYQPAYDKVRPVATTSRQERFMGTDFSYADFEARRLDDGQYKFLADRACGKAKCKVVEATPKPGSNPTYGRVVFEVHPKAKVPLRTRFFGLDGRTEVKTLTVNKLKKHQGRWVVFKATMKDLVAGSKTKLEILAIDFEHPSTPADFSTDALRNP